MMQKVAELDLQGMSLENEDVLIGFRSKADLHELIAAMVSQGKREVRYFAKKFDRRVVGHAPVPDAISAFLKSSRKTEFKSLVTSSQELVQSGSRLVELLRTNMPRVECRLRQQDNAGLVSFAGSFVLIDNHGYIYLPNPERFMGTASFNAAGTVDKFSEIFNQNWRLADLDAEMQPLHI